MAKKNQSGDAASDFDVNPAPAPAPESAAAAPASPAKAQAKEAKPAKEKFDPGADHKPPPMDARDMQATWERQNENIRAMRLDQLARESADVRWLMDQLQAANEKLAKAGIK